MTEYTGRCIKVDIVEHEEYPDGRTGKNGWITTQIELRCEHLTQPCHLVLPGRWDVLGKTLTVKIQE